MHGVVDEEVAALAGRQLMRVPGAVQLLWRVGGQSEPGPVTAGQSPLRLRLGASDRNHARAEFRRPLPGRKSST